MLLKGSLAIIWDPFGLGNLSTHTHGLLNAYTSVVSKHRVMLLDYPPNKNHASNKDILTDFCIMMLEWRPENLEMLPSWETAL